MDAWTEIMDAQRYDLSKRRPSHLTISTEVTVGHDDAANQSRQHFLDFTAALESLSDEHATNTLTEGSDETSTQNDLDDFDMNNHFNEFSRTTLNEPHYTALDPKGEPETEFSDVFERGGYIMKRTIIIRPRAPFFDVKIFSRPTSPASSPPTSPRSLNCMGGLGHGCTENKDTFEEHLAFIQQEREKELRGEKVSIQVRLQETQTVMVEELWRRPLEAITYRHAEAPVRDLVGKVEVS